MSVPVPPLDSGTKESFLQLKKARALCEEALALIDAHNGALEIGARLQEVIDELAEQIGQSGLQDL